ncbi:MAG: hypothetical protein EA355_07460 [Rhodobacteraceae bacterium]|nr:MAG: hypothetical protein EA355_07460 [Paracoccaceae bacterium]
MPCAPAPIVREASTARSHANSAWSFAEPCDRTLENISILWTAPWQAYWAFAFEALNPENYRR